MNDPISDQHVGDIKALMPDREMYPLYAQNTAKQMHSGRLNAKIRFVLITHKHPTPLECVWIDVGFGFFAIAGKEDKYYLSIKDLPEDALIINQHYVE